MSPLSTARRLLAAWCALVLGVFLVRAYPGWRDAAVTFVADLGAGEPFRFAGVAAAAPGHIASLAGLAALAVGWFGAGVPCVRFLVPGAGGSRGAILALVLGAGVTGLAATGAGLAGLLLPAFVAAGTAVSVIAGIRGALREGAEFFRSAADPAVRLPAALCGAAAAAGWLVSRLPDVFEDAAAQHFGVPEQSVAVHRLFGEPANTLWHFSLGGEMTFLPMLVLGGVTAAKLVNVAAALAAMALTARIAETLGAGRSIRWWAAAVTGSVAFIPGSCWSGKNDPLSIMFFATAAWCVLAARVGKGAWWYAAGACAGLSAGVKYPAVYVLPGVAAAAWWPGGRKPRGRALALAVLLVALSVGPWPARNWLEVGNPLHPVLSGLFPEPWWTPFHERVMAGTRRAFSTAAVKSALYPLFAPWDAAIDPGFGSPLVAILLPCVLVLAPVPAPVRALLGAAYAAWLFGDRFGRYLAPLLPVAAAAGVLSVARILAGQVPRLARAAAACLIGALVFSRVAVHLAPSGWRVVLGQVRPADWMRERLTTWEDARRWAAARTTLRSRLLLTGDERRLGMGGRVLTSGGTSEPMWKLTRESATAGVLRRRMRQLGVAFILHNHVQASYRSLQWVESPGWSPRQLVVYRDFMRRWLRPDYFQREIDFRNGGFAGWTVLRAPSPVPLAVCCLPQAEGRYRPAFSMVSAGAAVEAAKEAGRVGVPGGGVTEDDEVLAYCELAAGRPERARSILGGETVDGFVLRGGYVCRSALLAVSGDIDGAIRWKAREWLYLRADEVLRQLARLFAMRARDREIPAGRLAAAFRDLDRAAVLEPGDWHRLGLAAEVLERLGRRREALRYARRAQALAPGEGWIMGLVARLEGTITE